MQHEGKQARTITHDPQHIPDVADESTGLWARVDPLPLPVLHLLGQAGWVVDAQQLFLSSVCDRCTPTLQMRQCSQGRRASFTNLEGGDVLLLIHQRQ